MLIGNTVTWNGYTGTVIAVENRNGEVWIVADFVGYGTHQGPDTIFELVVD